MDTVSSCPRGAQVVDGSAPSTASTERSWKDFFRDPTHYRNTKTNQKASDFKHKLTKESLWMENQCNPSRPKDMPRLEKIEESHAIKETHQVQEKNREWEMLSLEEAISSLEAGTLPQPSVEDLPRILHMCIKEKNREYVLCLHAYLQKNGLESHTSLGNIVVSMLAEVGIICEAQQVFDRLVYRNEFSWKSLITGYVKCGEPQHALILYQKMQQDNSVYPSRYTFVALLKACAQLKDLERGRKIHAEIAKRGLIERDLFVGSTLVYMYAKCGSLAKAQEVFDKLPIRDVVSWNALLTGYAEHGHGEKALNCFEQMQLEGISPDAVTLLCSLKACASIGAVDKGQEIHARINRKGLLETDLVVGNTLVDMYAKCGFLTKAQEVFDKLPVRDVVSWTALISGYAEQGHCEEALNCFKQMQHKGVSPDAIMFVCSLKACGSIGARDRGQEIHAEIVRKGLDGNLNVCSSLVDMYAKCGFLETAQKMLDNILVRDAVSWNALIAGYAKNGCAEEALVCFDQMQREGVSPDAITFVCSLTACGSLGATDKGQEIYAEISRNGLLERDLAVANALVDMYGKCGLLAKAQKVFDNLLVRDVVSWTALIAGYAEHGHGEEALNCFEQMQLEGISPDALTLVCSLKACGSIVATEKGQEIHAEIAKKGLLERDVVVGNALVDMYAKCVLLAEAQGVFDELAVQNIVSWNALIGGYAQHKHDEEALNCFKQMQHEGISANSITYVCSLKACGSLGATEKGQEIHADIVRRGFLERDVDVGNALVDMYSKCGSLAETQDMFDKLLVRNVISWNALISGYAENEHGEDALNCFKQMQQEGLPPDAVTFVCCLKACGSLGATDKGGELHAEIARKGLMEKDLLLGSTLVGMYAKCGLLAKAQEVFDKLPGRDVVLWTSLIAGYAEHGCGEEALSWFEQMQHEAISPDAITFVCCLKACGSVGAIGKGVEIHAEIARKGLLERDLDVGNALVDMYAKCGWPAKAQEVFDKLPARDIVSWTALIAGYALLGESDNVFHFFERMIKEGEKPNLVTFISVLNVCSHTGLVDKGQMYFEAMSKDYGIIPALEHHTCIVDLLGRVGQLDKAVATIKQMPFHPNLVVWHTLLSACRKCGNVELGREVFEHAMRLDEKDAAAYVCMSNIYVEC